LKNVSECSAGQNKKAGVLTDGSSPESAYLPTSARLWAAGSCKECVRTLRLCKTTEENISDQVSYDRTKGQPEVIKASSMSD
jgi:hypothetical protein